MFCCMDTIVHIPKNAIAVKNLQRFEKAAWGLPQLVVG